MAYAVISAQELHCLLKLVPRLLSREAKDGIPACVRHACVPLDSQSSAMVHDFAELYPVPSKLLIEAVRRPLSPEIQVFRQAMETPEVVLIVWS